MVETTTSLMTVPLKQLIDLGIPWGCDLKKLTNFLRDGLPTAPNGTCVVDIRLMITNFGQCGESDSPTHKAYTTPFDCTPPLDHFKIVDRPDEEFQRAAACNILHDIARDESVLLVAGEICDWAIRTSHIRLRLQEGPVRVLSYSLVAFQPEGRKIARLRGTDVEDVNKVVSSCRKRRYGKGQLRIHGADAKTLRMDDKIVGWGGEDDDFPDKLSHEHN